jgi:hypothetical protein
VLPSPYGRGGGGEGGPESNPPLIDQFYVIVTCRDEKHRLEMLTRFKGEGLTCKAVVG